MVADAQTHDLPTTAAGFDRLARMMGEGDTDQLRRLIKERLNRVAALTEGFFAPGESRSGPDMTDEMRQIVDGWRSYPALRSERRDHLQAGTTRRSHAAVAGRQRG
jgi:glutamate-ammonia-ligase adenylyltransferase